MLQSVTTEMTMASQSTAPDRHQASPINGESLTERWVDGCMCDKHM